MASNKTWEWQQAYLVGVGVTLICFPVFLHAGHAHPLRTSILVTVIPQVLVLTGYGLWLRYCRR